MTQAPLLERLRTALNDERISEQKMFGGVCFMLSGNMLVGTSKRGLLVRVGKEAHDAAAALPDAAAMEMGGRAMQGYVFVAPEGTRTERDLNAWINRARAFVDTLPPKQKKAPARKASAPAKPKPSVPAKAPKRKR